MRTNNKAKDLKLGDKVTTDYFPDKSDVVRKITSINYDNTCGSGVRIVANGGEVCKLCGHIPSGVTPAIDGAWFIPVKNSPQL